MLENKIGIPVSMFFNKSMKQGELVIRVGTVEETIKINDWRSVHYLFQYCDKTIEKSLYVKNVINKYLSHSKEDQIDQSKFHFGKRDVKERQFIFRIDEAGFLWHWMTTSWKPLTIAAIRGLLPATAWEMTTIEPTDRHGGQITYNNMFSDSNTAIVTIDAGILDGMHAMSIKGKLIGELGEIVIDEKRKYRHTDISKIGSGLIETFEAMNRLHDMMPNIINITFNTDMLGEYKSKLGKDLGGKLKNGITVYHAIAILRDAGKKAIAGTVLINSAKGTVTTMPTVELIPVPITISPVETIEEPQIVITPVVE